MLRKLIILKMFRIYIADDTWILLSSGDQNYERVQFTVTGDNFRFKLKACSDVWITLSKIPGDFAIYR